MTAPNGSTVLFLGAGASAAFGYPVTSRILPLILRKLQDRTLFAGPAARPPGSGTLWPDADRDLTHGKAHVAGFSGVVETRSAAELMDTLESRLKVLLPGLERVGDNLPLITDVLSLIDHMIANGDACSPRFLPRHLEELRELLERAIMNVLSGPTDEDLAARGRERLEKLAGWLWGARERSQPPVTVISTNYDVLLENAIYRLIDGDAGALGAAIDFGFRWRDPERDGLIPVPPDPRVHIYKLHGSLNWLRCPLCGFIYINKSSMIYQLAFRDRLGWGNTCHCLQGPLRPLIVAPSMVRAVRDANLLSVWQRALEALRTAERWAIIGYSLPGEDLAIRSIFTRAERAHRGPLEVVVFQRGGTLEDRFRLLFPDCRYETGGIERFIEQLPAPEGRAE